MTVDQASKMTNGRKYWSRLRPDSVFNRIAWALVAGIVLVQVIGNSIWVDQIRQEVVKDTEENTRNLADALSTTLRYISKMPANYRAIMLEQLREAGGSRFYIAQNTQQIEIQSLPDSILSDLVITLIKKRLNQEWAPQNSKVILASPTDLKVKPNSYLLDLPAYIVSQHIILSPKPAPLLVVQIEVQHGVWIYMAALMPDPFFLDKYQPLTTDHIFLQMLTVITILILLFFVVRWITHPMQRLSIAAEKFGRGEPHSPIDTAGTLEYTRTAHAFNEMEQRIQRYMEDRERLFISISHDLRTPITRLRLRTGMLDDEQLAEEFDEDLEELELMVNGALQTVRDTNIHENHRDVDINKLLSRLIEPLQKSGRDIHFQPQSIPPVTARPLALKRALTNLLDNALHYGDKVEIATRVDPGELTIEIRDHGPGIKGNTDHLFQPYTRLPHGQSKNQQGLGLGLNIAQQLIHSHGGELSLRNHPQGGLLVEIRLPIQ